MALLNISLLQPFSNFGTALIGMAVCVSSTSYNQKSKILIAVVPRSLSRRGHLQCLFSPFGQISWYLRNTQLQRFRTLVNHDPGPASRAALYLLECWSMFRGNSHINTQRLHEKYGNVVRIMPNALSFNTAQAWKGFTNSHLLPIYWTVLFNANQTSTEKRPVRGN